MKNIFLSFCIVSVTPFKMVFVSHPTECDPSVCFNASQPDCREDQFIVEAKQEDPCCFSHLCGKKPLIFLWRA